MGQGSERGTNESDREDRMTPNAEYTLVLGGPLVPNHRHEAPVSHEDIREHLIAVHGTGETTYFIATVEEAAEQDLEYHDHLHRMH